MAIGDDAELIDRFEEFYRDYYRNEIGELAQKYPNEQRSFYLNWNDLYRYDSDIADDFVAKPRRMREYAEEALRLYDLPVDVKLGGAHIRVKNLSEVISLAEIRSEHLGNLIAISGRVKTVSETESALQEAAYECQRCGTLTRIPRSSRNADAQEPHQCQGCERQGPFEINFDQSEFVDRQTLLVEQRTEADSPESILVELEDDIVDSATVGDRVVVTGILTREQPGEYNESSSHDKFIEALSVEESNSVDELDISEADEREIVELSADEDIYDKFVGTIAPAIHGYESQKLALALQLFGGVRKELPDGTVIRGDIHVMMFGDPGTAKSALGEAARRLSPNGIRVSGSGHDTSAVGLTAAAVKSKGGTGDSWEVRGGAAVLADQGFLFVDDAHGLRNEAESALAGVLEEQTVDVSKATINTSLPARAAVFCAANPKYGHFDEYEPIADQIDLDAGLISSFDLLFTAKDQPDTELDRKVADHILDTHHGGGAAAHANNVRTSGITDKEVKALLEASTPAITPDIARKYVAYARENCFPTLTEGAKENLREFYIDMRSHGDADSPAPMTARKLDALVRLAEASARLRLADQVTTEDTERAIALVRTSLGDIGMEPETGELDADMVEAGTSEEQRELIKKVKGIIRELQDEYDDGAPYEQVLKRAEQGGIPRSKAEHEMQRLKGRGDVYEPKTDHLRLV